MADCFDGAVVLIAGFAACGWPESLLRALSARGVGNLTVVGHGAWPVRSEARSGPSGVVSRRVGVGLGPDLAPWPGPGQAVSGIEELVAGGQVRRLISPLAFYPGRGGQVEERWRSGELKIEVVPQGILAERLRAGGAGLGGVFLPAGAGTRFSDGREARRFAERDHVFEPAVRADFALLRAHAADTLGNLVYRATQRNWNPVMAMAARVSIVEVDEIFDPGGLDPEAVITPGIFVNRIVQTV